LGLFGVAGSLLSLVKGGVLQRRHKMEGAALVAEKQVLGGPPGIEPRSARDWSTVKSGGRPAVGYAEAVLQGEQFRGGAGIGLHQPIV
jgi:hypothetical protein